MKKLDSATQTVNPETKGRAFPLGIFIVPKFLDCSRSQTIGLALQKLSKGAMHHLKGKVLFHVQLQ